MEPTLVSGCTRSSNESLKGEEVMFTSAPGYSPHSEPVIRDADVFKMGELKHLRRGLRAGKRSLRGLGQFSCGPFLLLELFSGQMALTQAATTRPGWEALRPRDLQHGDNLLDASVQQAVMYEIQHRRPNLVTLAPPCGPWSPLQNLSKGKGDPGRLEALRTVHYKFWLFSRRVWEAVNEYGGLCLN